MDEIVQLLTEPRYAGKMVVILAGYEAQVRVGWGGGFQGKPTHTSCEAIC